MAHLSLAGRSHSTVRTYLAGIGARHRLNGWLDPSESFLIKKLLQGLTRCTRKADARYPITLQRLGQLVSKLPLVCSNSYEATLFQAAYTLAFFGFFRVSDIVGQPRVPDGRMGMQFIDVTFDNFSLDVHLKHSKTDQSGTGCHVNIPQVGSAPEVCPVTAMKRFLQVRPQTPGPLFVHFDGSQLTRYQFQAVLKKVASLLGWPPKGFSSHSFRIGAATTAALNGVPVKDIMLRGRWLSHAVHNYIRQEKA